MAAELPPTHANRAESERIVIYDGECRLCVAAREGIERLGGGAGDVRFIPYRSAEAACRLGAAYKTGRPDVAFLVDRDGCVSRGLDAFIPLLPGIRGGRLILRLLRLPFGRPLAYLAYRIIARNRYRWFGAADAPADPDARRRNV
jgi:predicted DCC family thiol-disulfide oxidoreductase YuxK